MNTVSKPKRFTLSLPERVHAELSQMATENSISSKDVVIKSLKLGMIAFQTENDPSKELIIRERLENGQVSETKLLLI